MMPARARPALLEDRETRGDQGVSVVARYPRGDRKWDKDHSCMLHFPLSVCLMATKKKNCSKFVLCLSLVVAASATPAPTAAGERSFEENPSPHYQMMTVGTCDPAKGQEFIESSTYCAAAAQQLSLADTTVSVVTANTSLSTSTPYGCYYKDSSTTSKLWFNSYGIKNSNDNQRLSICRVIASASSNGRNHQTVTHLSPDPDGKEVRTVAGVFIGPYILVLLLVIAAERERIQDFLNREEKTTLAVSTLGSIVYWGLLLGLESSGHYHGVVQATHIITSWNIGALKYFFVNPFFKDAVKSLMSAATYIWHHVATLVSGFGYSDQHVSPLK